MDRSQSKGQARKAAWVNMGLYGSDISAVCSVIMLRCVK